MRYLRKILCASLFLLTISIIPSSFAWDGSMAMDADKRNAELGQIINYQGYLYGDFPITNEAVLITVLEKDTKKIILSGNTIPETSHVEYFENTAWPFTFQVDTLEGFAAGKTYVVEAMYDDKSTKLEFFIQPGPEPTCLEILGGDDIMVFTDKDNYEQGDTIQVSGCLSARAFANTINVTIYDPEGNKIGISTLIPKTDRTFSDQYIIDEKFGLDGTYFVEVDADGLYSSTKSFVVPERLDLSLKSSFKEMKYKNFIVDDVVGIITIKDQKIDLANLKMTTMAAKMTTSAAYTSKEAGVAAIDFDFKIFDIDLSKLTELLPVLDTLLPMVNSFEGKVNARMKGNTKVDKNLNMSAASIDAIARVTGVNLVVLSGKTFEKMAKMLLFKNKEKNTIDTLEFAMIFKDKQIEIFPSVVTVDRYKVAIGGRHKLDLTYDYHVSILKSPMPFKAGIDLKGTEEDMDFKITKAKYKYLFSTKERQQKKADSTLIKQKMQIINSLPF